MQITISALHNHETLFQKEYPTDFITEKGMEETEVNFKSTFGKGKFLEYWFEGMHILVADLLPERLSTLRIQTADPVYILMFCLEGLFKCRTETGSKDFELKLQEGIFITAPVCMMEVELLHHTKTICIQLTEKCFRRLILKDSQSVLINSTGVFEILPAMKIILNSMLERRYPTGIKRIFLETKILKLLFLQLAQQWPTVQSGPTISLRKHDIKSIHFAKLLIEQNIRAPYSIIELARKVGLNDFKLKKGFKELLGITVFGYLHELRMERARQLLIDEKKTVNFVADEVGYKNSHHFSSAFKKKYGVMPSQLNK